MRIKKKKKSKGQRGNTTYGHGARKKWRSSGEHGGKGMSGTGKRADHKKSLVIKLYGNKYFGKQGITSKKTQKKKKREINIRQLEKDFDSLMKKYGKGETLDLRGYKILGDGEITRKIILKTKEITQSAKEKIEKAGGKVIIEEKISQEKIEKSIKKEK